MALCPPPRAPLRYGVMALWRYGAATPLCVIAICPPTAAARHASTPDARAISEACRRVRCWTSSTSHRHVPRARHGTAGRA
eukprot:1362932-Prymnesium_polylepis.1